MTYVTEFAVIMHFANYFQKFTYQVDFDKINLKSVFSKNC